MRPFFNRVWERGLISRSAPHSRSLALDPFSSAARERDRLERQNESNSDLALVGAEVDMHTVDKAIDKDDAASRGSQRGIVRTVEVRMDWNDKGHVVSRYKSYDSTFSLRNVYRPRAASIY
jgi:hypothetical protein